MLNPYLALPIYIALGAGIIAYARYGYSRPRAMMEGSIPHLPQRGCAVALYRGLCIVWIFGGFLMISEGVVLLPALANHHGILTLLVVISIAAVATIAVLRLTSRR